MAEVFLAVDIFPKYTGQGPTYTNPVNVCIVLDTSGSMADEEKLEQAKQAAIQFVRSLGPSDTISLISFARKVRNHIAASKGVNINHFENVVNSLKASGGTNLYNGIKSSYSEAARGIQLQPNAVNRIILLTDGQPTVGKNKPSDFISLSQQIQASGISIVSIGLGSDYNEDLLSIIASNSNGFWYHIMDPSDIAVIFQEQFREMKTVLMTRPRLVFQLMSGAEISDIYKVRPMLNKIEDTHVGGNTYEISLTDIVGGKEQNIIFKMLLPARTAGEFRIARVDLKSGSQRLTHDVVVEYTDDSNLYLKEYDPYPRVLLQSSESTVMLRAGISLGDETKINEAQTKLGKTLSDQDAQTIVRKHPLLNDMVTVFNSAYQETVVKKQFTPEELKEIKSKTTTLKKRESSY